MNRLLTFVALLTLASPSAAHFPWLFVTEESHPRLFFGEGLADRDYHLPEAVAAAEVWQAAIDAPNKALKLEPLEEKGFVGLEGEDPIEPRGRLQTTVVYGSYHGSKLTYYAQHFPDEAPAAWPTAPAAEQRMQARLTVESGRLRATVLLDGKPLAGVEATLSHEDGGPGSGDTTDDEGVAEFELAKVQEGLNGLMVMHVDKSESGEVNGSRYKSATHILTATFHYSPDATSASALTPLPEAVSSFGAAVSGDWLYVYGGHIGQAHDHSRDNLSKHFRRLRVDGEGEWQDLAPGPALQGLALVEHNGKLYRIGGLDARNAAGAEQDLHSVATFAEYDPASDKWTDLPPLPGPRSSHNAVVLEGVVYVVGGWALTGDDQGEWQAGALAYELGAVGAAWRELPEPPFKRRALAVSHAGGKVVALCGMSEEAKISQQVFTYDPQSQVWAEGPEFPGKPFDGFGLAAWNVRGALYAGGLEGTLYRLSATGDAWEEADRFAMKRFFHQLVPDGRGGLLAVAGATHDAGHTSTIERLDLRFETSPAKAAGAGDRETLR